MENVGNSNPYCDLPYEFWWWMQVNPSDPPDIFKVKYYGGIVSFGTVAYRMRELHLVSELQVIR